MRWLAGLIPSLGLSQERKLDLVGLLLIALGMVTALNWLTPGEGALGGLWLSVLRRLFGLGAYAIPFLLLGSGLWLLLRDLGERIPRPKGEQIAGAGLLFFTSLMALQAFDGAAELVLGRGGGWLGENLLALMVGAFGGPGTAVALLTCVLVGLTLTVGISIPELAAQGLRAYRFVSDRLTATRGQGGEPARSSEPQQPAETRAEPAAAGPGRKPAVLVRPGRRAEAGSAEAGSAEATIEQNGRRWSLPALEGMLEVGSVGKADEEFDRQRAKLIEDTLTLFGAPAKVVEVNRGPTITQFGVEPAFMEGRAGKKTKVKVSKVAALADDLALALAAPSIRIEAPAPGKGFIGIEVPNAEISLVALRDVIDSETFRRQKSNLRLGLGRDVSGRPVAADLTSMPHLLIAGTTGSGKSVCVNALVACLLLLNTPDDLRFLMIDPKRVELTYYNGIPHLLTEVIVELDRVVPALQWISRQMDERYRRFSVDGVRNIVDYNERQRLLNGKTLPYIAVVIDELADLMMMAPDETERVITRLAQLARATGIHLVVATQRPSVDVITGLIKANFPTRIAFAVTSMTDSRTILDGGGAEKLLGRGDMLYMPTDAAKPTRIQGVYMSDPEVERLVEWWTDERFKELAPENADDLLREALIARNGGESDVVVEDDDPSLAEAREVANHRRRVSPSLLQRRLNVGYSKAEQLILKLEQEGIVGPREDGESRRVLVSAGGDPDMGAL
jgi:S-DNA-T family DNA segregation ATPase FtsK/SpoIIIE